MRKAFSVAIFVRRTEAPQRVLLIHHKRLSKWLPVGGEMVAGETPLAAAKRELVEETGLTKAVFPAIQGAFDGVPVGFLGYEEHDAGQKGMHMNFVFVAEITGEVIISPNHEFSEYQWVTKHELRELEMPQNVREFGLLALSVREDVRA